MNILLTGGTGYIGSHTAVELAQVAQPGDRLVLLDNLCNSDATTIDQIHQILSGHNVKLKGHVDQQASDQIRATVHFVKGDIRDTALLTQVMREHHIQAVIHFAGLKAVGESVANPLDYYANNVQGSVSLLQAMQDCHVHKIVFSSSATVYGEPKYLPLDESHPTSATNPYGRTKLHIEEMVFDLCQSNPSISAICLRYFNPVGAHPSGLIGEYPKGTPNNLMPYITQVASGQRSHLSVFGNDYPTPDGSGVRDYIHVVDLALGHIAALNLTKKQTGWHAINLGTGQGHSVLELIRIFEEVNQVRVPYQVVARRPGDVAECYASTHKAQSVLNWRAKLGLREMCESAWQYQVTHKYVKKTMEN